MDEDVIFALIAVGCFFAPLVVIGVVHGAQYAAATIIQAKDAGWDFDAVRVEWRIPNSLLHRAEGVIFRATHNAIIAVAKLLTLPLR